MNRIGRLVSRVQRPLEWFLNALRPNDRADPTMRAKGYLHFLNRFSPKVLSIVYWDDWRQTVVVLGGCLLVWMLLTLTFNTFIHTIVVLLLSFLVVSLAYIVINVAVDSFYNKEIKNPFSVYLNRKITLPEEEILEWTKYVVGKLDSYINTLVRLLFFDNFKASLKFGVALWLLSFVTNCFTLLTSLFLLVILLFTIPPLYERFQAQIDTHVDAALARGRNLFDKVRSSLPTL